MGPVLTQHRDALEELRQFKFQISFASNFRFMDFGSVFKSSLEASQENTGVFNPVGCRYLCFSFLRHVMYIMNLNDVMCVRNHTDS
ncbi:hypothetical protein ANN_06369 [Periplaneta americana]|uniref:Uncharacterized protein n=1 Tax=Periplaneta americana TaxID=6978 RepID=A0ABQ8TF37_PERAM|nr:hypothetical protein ANN_06369 [Periplaneta americana]